MKINKTHTQLMLEQLIASIITSLIISLYYLIGKSSSVTSMEKNYINQTPYTYQQSNYSNKYGGLNYQTSRNTEYGNIYELNQEQLELKNRILNNTEPFPFKNRFQSLSEIKQKFINLHNHKTVFVAKQFVVPHFTLPPSKEHTMSTLLMSNLKELFKHNQELLMNLFNNQAQNKTYDYVAIPIPETAYGEKNDISDYFNEEVRMTCMRNDQPMSSLEYWQKNPSKIVEYCLKNYYTLDLYELRETMYELWYECTTFKPSCIVDFIRLFGAERILDISSGWGDRLLGALSQGVKYVGVDPNTRLFPGYAKIVKFAEETIAESNIPDWKFQQPILICSPFETAVLPAHEFDLVFSSPPFFDLEKYSNEPTQSMHGKKTLKDWYDGFLRVVIIKAWNKLKIGGHLVLYINDIKNREPFIYNMLQDMDNWVRTAESKPFYLGCVIQYNETPTFYSAKGGGNSTKFDYFVNSKNDTKYGARKKSEVIYGQPFWIWRKISA